MSSHTLARRAATLACAVAVLAAACAPALAQSGRRPPQRRPDPPAPAGEKPAPAAPSEDRPPSVPISVTKDLASLNIPHAVARFVVDECMARLRSVERFAPTGVRDMRRGDAENLAKGGDATYVLWLEFSIDAADAEKAALGPPDLRNLVVRYVLYAPGTGDVRTQGRLHFTAAGARITNGRVLVPDSGRGRGPSGYTLEEVGEKIAEYVMEALGVPAAVSLPRR
jgi:hypothetical protein